LKYTEDQVKTYRAEFARRHRIAGVVLLLFGVLVLVGLLGVFEGRFPGIAWRPAAAVLGGMGIAAVAVATAFVVVHRCPACNALLALETRIIAPLPELRRGPRPTS